MFRADTGGIPSLKTTMWGDYSAGKVAVICPEISTVPLLSPEAKRLQLGYTGNAHTAQARFDGL